MLRKLAFLAILVVVLAVAYGAAAGLIVGGGAVQAGLDASLYCDQDGVSVTGWGTETDDSKVYSVTIGGIDPTCNGNKMHVRLYNSSGTALNQQVTKTIGSTGSETFSFNTPPQTPIDIASIETLKVWIDGPNP